MISTALTFHCLTDSVRIWNSLPMLDIGLMRLERRRVRSDLIEAFKITKGMYDVIREVFLKLDDNGRREHDQELFKRDLDLM